MTHYKLRRLNYKHNKIEKNKILKYNSLYYVCINCIQYYCIPSQKYFCHLFPDIFLSTIDVDT